MESFFFVFGGFSVRVFLIVWSLSVLDKESFCDHGFCGDIRKAILVHRGGLLEIHGADKKSWTYLADHLFRNNQPIPSQELSILYYNRNIRSTTSKLQVPIVYRSAFSMVTWELLRNSLKGKVWDGEWSYWIWTKIDCSHFEYGRRS